MNCRKSVAWSASFIGSKTSKFAGELPLQRVKTDKMIEMLQARLNSFDPGSYSRELKTVLSVAMNNLDEL
ncbi:MAG: hypothetical protein ACXWT2_07085 [Methylovulum sp.]